MDDYTVQYLKQAFFETGELEIRASETFNDIGLDWDDESNLLQRRVHEKNEGWYWDGTINAQGITWGGCLESIDKMFRHEIAIPSLDEFKNIVLITETSEEIPSSDYVLRMYKELGERGILERVQAVLVGRPKAWEFNNRQEPQARIEYRRKQREVILNTVCMYNKTIPIIQNMDFGHTDPQIPLPYGASCRIDGTNRKIFIEF